MEPLWRFVKHMTGARSSLAVGHYLPSWYLALALIAIIRGGAYALPPSGAPGIEPRLIGHPLERFPLTVYVETDASNSLKPATEDAISKWNSVFRELFCRAAFASTDEKNGADT